MNSTPACESRKAPPGTAGSMRMTPIANWMPMINPAIAAERPAPTAAFETACRSKCRPTPLKRPTPGGRGSNRFKGREARNSGNEESSRRSRVSGVIAQAISCTRMKPLT